MFKVTDVSSDPGGTAHLVITGNSAFLCDTGFAFSAEATVANIRAALEGEGPSRLDYILLTHSHFDHAAGTSTVARAFREAKVVASRYAAEVFIRPGARRAIRDMDEAAARNAGADPGEDTTSGLRVDIEVGDGDVVRTADRTVRVYATPGHTNCSVSYYFEEDDILATSESSGFKFGDIVWPAFLTSYRDSIESIELVKRLAPERLLLPHAGLISGSEVSAYLSVIKEKTEEKAAFILSRHRAGMSEEEIVKDFISEYFDRFIRDTGLQTEESFVANTRALVPRLIAEAES
ncbi:MAG: MBL fold metallo-hydrolase [Clostridiales Family XIII bacterium]|jgi:glyoxylase-like metal-dependent hydrolase (beta-lactamase superfamily II)|nr:MBL fold metallo-hydrolase [Clostridiales Family XIII bacterium]